MCKKTNYKTPNPRIDRCMDWLIGFIKYHLKGNKEGIKLIACCCGHGKYPMTILVRDKKGIIWDICSFTFIYGRKRKFYRRDKEGYYYIPEVINDL